MKAGIVICLGEMVKNKFGKPKWEAVLEGAGLTKSTMFIPIQDVDDALVARIIESACAVLKIDLEKAGEAFGDYWVNVYAPDIYKSYFKSAKSVKDFLLQMDRVHESVTMNIPNATPPRFNYEWPNDKTLVMKYTSGRGLVDILAGCAKGVGKYFGENIKVSKLGGDRIEVVFPK